MVVQSCWSFKENKDFFNEPLDISRYTNDEDGQAIFETTVKKQFSELTLSFWPLWSNDFDERT